MDHNSDLLQSELQLDEISTTHLKETARWAKFLGILGFIFSLIIALGGIFAGTILKSMSRIDPEQNVVLPTGLLSGFYIIIAVIYFMMSLYLYYFGAKMQVALQVKEQAIFNDSLLNLKRLYRIMGIIMIVYLGIMLLAIVAVVLTALFAS